MKALILAGGAGTRLRPITHSRAKQLVPVANKPILFYGIEAMVDAGITDIGVIVGDTRDEVMAALGDGSTFGASITYIPQDAPLGLAHCVLIARPFLGDDEFVMYLGDNLLEQDLSAFVSAFSAARASSTPPSAQILLKHVPDPQRFGIATLDADGHVVRLVEKPNDPPSDLALVGVYLFDATIHEAVASIKPSDRGELEITDAIQWLIDEQHLVRCELLERLVDRHREAHATARGEPAAAREDRAADRRLGRRPLGHRRTGRGRGRRRDRELDDPRSRVRSAPDTRIVDSFIGPYSAIGNGCEVSNSEIEHSVVMDDSRIIDILRLEDSLIGSDAVITRSRTRPRALRLMVGDHCQVDIE